MKRILTIILILAAFIAAESAADAQLLKNVLKKAVSNTETKNETASVATSSGKSAGTALRNLYTQYKTDGKLDVSNLNTLMNLVTLSQNIKELKGQSSNAEFYKEFASALVLGSDNLVTETTTDTVMEGLSSIAEEVDLDAVASTAESAASTVSKTVNDAADKANEAVENASEIAGAVTDILSIFK